MNELDLFSAALGLTNPDERRAYLDRACAHDPALRRRLDDLLVAHALSVSPLDRPAVSADQTGDFTPQPEGEAPTTPYHSEARAGDVVAAKYMLVEVIGEGGMGSVWRAKQTEPVKRFVAVKLIKAGMDSKQVVARFEAERQALALMDHPNIAKVLDGGLDRHRPYFVMELVKGTPITDYCDAAKLTPHARLELFVQACQAIQHAHQKGIIHRDIKPSNVLVALYDDKPVVKVIDFGVAKATGGALTEATIDTGFGGVVGTPQYMSPEQATFNNLDIDTRSDVYALGVLLYELLTGSTPFSKKELEKKGLLEILRVVREDEPPRPSTKLSTADALPSLSANRGTEPGKLTGMLRNELDWIVMKALEKDRARRYETANGFAADINRYLCGEAVLAHPPSAAYRMRKFVRRNKGQVIAASLVFLALVAGVVGTTWGLVRAERARADLLVKNAELDAERDKVQARFDTAVKAIATFHTGVSEDALLKNEQFQELRTKLLKQAAGFYAELEKLLVGQTDAKSRKALAAGYFQLGNLQETLGNLKEALAIQRQSLGIRRELAEAPGADLGTRLDVGHSLCAEGWVLYLLDDPNAALREFQGMRNLAAVLEAESPTDAVRQQLAQGHVGIAAVLDRLERPADSLAEERNALAIRRKLANDNPANAEFLNELANSYGNIGLLLNLGGSPVEALEMLGQAASIRRKLADADPANPTYQLKLGQCHRHIGFVLLNTGRPEESLKAFRQALAVIQKISNDQPAVASFQESLADIHNVIGVVLVGIGKPAEALERYDEALAVMRKLAKANPGNATWRNYVAWFQNNRGRALGRLNRFPEAFADIDASLATHQRWAESDPGSVDLLRILGWNYGFRGGVRVRAGQPVEAAADLRKALELWAKVPQPDIEMKVERARALALLAGLAVDPRSGVTETEAKAFAEQSVAVLAAIAQTGWALPSELREPDWDAVRGRVDFRKLVEEVGAKAEKPEEAKP